MDDNAEVALLRVSGNEALVDGIASFLVLIVNMLSASCHSPLLVFHSVVNANLIAGTWP